MKAEFIASPLTYGSEDQYYSFNLDYFTQSDLGNDSLSKLFKSEQAASFSDWQGNLGGNFVNYYPGAPIAKPFVRPFGEVWDKDFYRYLSNTPFGIRARRLEDSVGTRTYAAQIAGFSVPGVPKPSDWTGRRPWLISETYSRPTSRDIEKVLTDNLKDATAGGFTPFNHLFKAANNGFLVSWGNDYDVNFDDQIEDISGDRLLSTYWPERLGKKHPLRDIYDMYYNPSSTNGRYWNEIEDFNSTQIKSFSGSPYSQFFVDANKDARKRIELDGKGGTNALVLGPISNTDIELRNGHKIVAASPVMTPAIQRTWRLSDEKSDHNDPFKADTVLYPSPVGAYQSNTLSLGEGNHIIFYDSSFSRITSKGGDSVYLPSFGSFNWSIDWIPGLASGSTSEPPLFDGSWLPSNLVSDQGPALISPIPWDEQPVNPKMGSNKTGTSYAKQMADFAKSPERGSVDNQQNFLYTVFSKRGSESYDGKDYTSKKILQTYLNLKQDQQSDNPWQSRNPVNRLGGIDIYAGKDQQARGKANYLRPTGNNVFFGMDWEFWKNSLPSQGSTIANNPAGLNGQKRPAQLEWNTVTMAGGRGNNTFNLGNVMDNITNNGLFYKGKASYLLSLTHDDIYPREVMLDEGMAFGNAFNDPDDQQSAYISTVNLNLQADTTSYTMMVQAAEAGQAGVSKNATASAWLGAVGWAQKAIKTPFDLNKDWVEYQKLQDEKEVAFWEWDDNKQDFSRDVAIVEKQPKPATWLSKSKFFSRMLGSVFPAIDIAIGTFSAVKGLYDLFTAKPERAPKQELKSVFLEAGLQPANKAVVINDWHPGATINLNLPSIDASDWKALSISVKEPDSTSSDYRKNGAYVQVGRTTTTADTPGMAVSTDWPLVVFQNLDLKDRVDQVQKNDGGFAYYTYSFVDPDNSAELQRDQFNPIRSSSLRMFARLTDPSKLLGEDGKPLNIETFGDQFVYRSDSGFDMRYDAENYGANQKALQDSEGENQVYRYSKYYFDDKFAGKEGLRSDFDADRDIYPYTSNVSVEFDSRVHGWYWQPVYNTDLVTADEQRAVDPASLPLDYESSKLWINDPTDGWVSYSFNELDNNIEAFRYSRLASTFYATSTDKDKDGVSDGQEEINRRLRFDRQLKLLEEYGDSLYDIDQRLISNDTNLFSLNQIQKVEEMKRIQYGDQIIKDALVVSFETVKKDGEPISRKLILHKRDGVAQRALLATDDLEAIAESEFRFNLLVDQSDPSQRYVPDPNNPIAPAVRTFAGIYNEKANTTQLYEYVAFPKDDINGLTFDESREAARNRELPSSLATSGVVTSHLATIDNAAENDAITGWFKGTAWLGADNMGVNDFYPNTDFWQWIEGDKKNEQFWSEQDPNIGFDFRTRDRYLQDGPIDNRYSNWGISNRPIWHKDTRQVLTIAGDSGDWDYANPSFESSASGSPVTGYVSQYTFEGLPSFI